VIVEAVLVIEQRHFASSLERQPRSSISMTAAS
jgi:hypothetical protein